MGDVRNDNEERFAAYLDGELPPDEVTQLEDELAASPELAAAFERYRKTVELLGSLGEVEPPTRLAERIEGRIRRRSHGRYFRVGPRLRLPYEALASVVLLAIMISMFLAAGPRGETPVLPPAPSLQKPNPQTAPLARYGVLETVKPGELRLRVPTEMLPSFEKALGELEASGVTVLERNPGKDGTIFLLRLRE